MGRCNNRRAQEAAAARNNVPSRARFSKGPPKKGRGGKGGRSGRGGGGGRSNGRGGGGRGSGGRGSAKESVISKISQRVASKQRDAGGISVVSSSIKTTTSTIKRKKRHALDGVDIMKLDEIKLSEESAELLSGILMELGVMEKTATSSTTAASNVASMPSKQNIEEEKKEQEIKRKKGAGAISFVQDELMATFNHMDSDDEQSEASQQIEEEYEEQEIDDGNVYSLSNRAATAATINRGRKAGVGGYEEYEDEPEYIHREEEKMIEDEEDEYAFLDSTKWAEEQLRLEEEEETFKQNESISSKEYKEDVADVRNVNNQFESVSITNANNNTKKENVNENNEKEDKEEEKAKQEAIHKSPLYQHLTSELSFTSSDAERACRAVENWDAVKSTSEGGGDDVDSDNLGLALDWLCLHLTEEELKNGFKPNPKTLQPPKQAPPAYKRDILLVGTGATKPIPHSSISIAPTFDRVESNKSCRIINFARLGFAPKEINTAVDMTANTEASVSAEEDEVALRILLSLLEKEEFKEKEGGIKGKANAADLEYASMERVQEIQALEAIFPTEFEIVTNNLKKQQFASEEEKEAAAASEQRYKLKVTPITPLQPPAQSTNCTLHVFTRTTYPILSPPLLLFTNPTLPPSLLRRINISLLQKAKENVGEPILFELMEYIGDLVPTMQKEFIKEQNQKEFDLKQIQMRKAAGHTNIESTIEAQYDAEEDDGKKLGRRQRAKLKAIEKSYNYSEVMAAQEEERLKKQEERISKAQADMKAHRTIMAQKAILEREKEKIEEEAEKAARAAMNAAFNQGESAEVARAAAKKARIECLRSHGEDMLDYEEKKGVGKKDGEEKKKNTITPNGKPKISATLKEEDGSKNENGNIKKDVTNASTRNENSTTSNVISIGDNDKEDANDQSKKTATQTTLAFTERLKAFYQAKAKEKAMRDVNIKDGNDGATTTSEDEGDIDDDFCGLHLTKPADNSSSDEPPLISGGEPSSQHEPAPVFVPNRALNDVMKDVIKDQSEQPWLVSPDARAPTLDYHPDASVQTMENLTPEQIQERNEISRQMKKDLQRRFKAAEQWEKKFGSSTAAPQSNKRNQGSEPLGQKFQKMMSQRSRLPAYKMEDEIVKTIAKNQITVISGDTGCGKTTQVPQLVLDNMIWNNRGAEANIIVTQPRRISAIGVSERIASERCERVGETAGYSIRLENKRSAKTRLLLCTTGILLRRLQVDPDLASVSHVFVDEVHERDLNTDFLLIILKDLLSRRKSLKLVLMSATLNADTFSKYFDGCPTTSIPGRAHPVKELRLEDVLQATGYQVEEDSDYVLKKKDNEKQLSKSALKKLYKSYKSNVINSLAIVDENIINYELLAKLLEYITMNEGEGAILCFLPGMQEITKAIEELYKNQFFTDSSKVVIYPLHSSLSTAEQTAVFDVPPDGVRKIVVSTNIAETSITIEDVVFVVDAGRVKENRHDEENQMPTLVECWVSRASAKQRRGRAGRVRPGICYHMYSSHTHDRDLEEYQLPEMLRVGLEDLVLQVLLLDLGEPSAFLTKAVNPPSALAIRNSLKLLEGLGAVECEWDDEGVVRAEADSAQKSSSCESLNVSSGLTALGFHLATLPVDPRVGKMMIYGALFGCIDPALTIAASMSARSPFMSPFDKRDEADAARKEFSTEGSDHLATLTAFNRWKALRQREGERSVNQFLRESFLSRLTLSQVEDLRKQFSDLLIDIGFLPKSYRCGSGSRLRYGKQYNKSRRDNLDSSNGFGDKAGPNSNSSNLHLLKAILCAGLYPNIIIAPRSLVGPANDRKKEVGECAFQSQKGEVYLHPCCISFKEKYLDSRYCCYHEIVKTSKIYVRDCTTVSEFALLLFGGSLKVYHTHGVVTVDSWLKFRIAAKPATLVKHLRAQMESMLLRKIVSPDDDVTNAPEGKALIQAVSTLLAKETKEPPNRSGANIVRPWNDQRSGQSSTGGGQSKGRGRGRVSGTGRGGRTGGRGRGSYRSRGGGRG